jgi:hypothetical protein
MPLSLKMSLDFNKVNQFAILYGKIADTANSRDTTRRGKRYGKYRKL